MLKVCSLDFLNQKFFEKDIISKNGKVFFEAKDEVTPEALLKLYFKNIYVQNSIEESSTEVHNKIKNSLTNTKMIISTSKKDVTSTSQMISVIETPVEIEATLIENSNQPINETSSNNDAHFYNELVKYSIKTAKILEFSEEEIEQLNELSYYYTLKEEDGTVSAEMKKIINLCYEDYNVEKFSLNKQIPCYYIIQIVGYYIISLKEIQSKQKTILKMLQLGSNKFNPFVLHKFLNMVKKD